VGVGVFVPPVGVLVFVGGGVVGFPGSAGSFFTILESKAKVLIPLLSTSNFEPSNFLPELLLCFLPII
jgi:hypothetical protein